MRNSEYKGGVIMKSNDRENCKSGDEIGETAVWLGYLIKFALRVLPYLPATYQDVRENLPFTPRTTKQYLYQLAQQGILLKTGKGHKPPKIYSINKAKLQFQVGSKVIIGGHANRKKTILVPNQTYDFEALAKDISWGNGGLKATIAGFVRHKLENQP